MQSRKLLLGAGLALPVAEFVAAARAQAPQPERVIRVPAGSMVLVLPGTAAVAAPAAAPMPFGEDFPVMRMMAAQHAMVERMMQQMRVLDQLMLPLPDPAQAIRSAMDGVPRLAPGSSMVTTMVSDGRGACRQTITYRSAAGEKPVVHMAQKPESSATPEQRRSGCRPTASRHRW